MPWSNQSGGPRKPGGPGPWGQGPNGGGVTPPDFEDLLRRGQDKLRALIPGGSFTGRGLIALVLIGVLVWALSGVYTVQTNEVGLNFLFGRYTGFSPPGLNYNFPAPIGSYDKLEVTDRRAIDIGTSFQEDTRRSGFQTTTRDVPEESLMLTSDLNIADVKFRVIWQIDPASPQDFAFNIHSPAETVKAVAESAMRQIVGRTEISRLLTAERKNVQPAAQDLMQRVLKAYGAGVLVLEVQLLSVDPPQQVISAYRDVTAAQQDRDRMTNEAESYANTQVPNARGQAAGILQKAEGYKLQAVAEARGQASRFDQIYAAYRLAPGVTRERMYLETMESVLGGTNTIIIDNKGTGVLPYLPLGELTKNAPASGAVK
jgi:modulator of FtsH protease HflK